MSEVIRHGHPTRTNYAILGMAAGCYMLAAGILIVKALLS